MEDIAKAFSSVVRLKILSCLKGKNQNVTYLVKHCGLSQSAVSQHLKKLRDLGIVDCQTKGKEKLYQLKYNKIGTISKDILKLINNKK